MMDLLELIQPVVVSGRDIFGRKSQITFAPYDFPGWHWKCGNEVVPINSSIALCNSRRITLVYKEFRLEIYEHIGALRWTGLDGIIIESPKFPPYHGRTKELWDALKPFCQKTGNQGVWVKPLEGCLVIGADDASRKVSFEPLDGKLIISVILKIKKLGERVEEYELPMLLEEIFEAHSLGWPPYLYYVSKLAKAFGWPHHENVGWVQKNTADILLEKICRHRLVDLLGALSLVTHEHFLSGRVVSYKGGHAIDLGMINRMIL